MNDNYSQSYFRVFKPERMQTQLLLPSTLALIILFASCEGPDGAPTTAKLSGRVEVYSERGILDTVSSGVTVSIEGTSISTTTDARWNWSIQGIAGGIHNIQYSKPGYGFNRSPSIRLAGGDIDIGSVRLIETPHYAVTSVTVSFLGDTLHISGTVSDSITGVVRSLPIFFGKIDPMPSDPTTYLLNGSAENRARTTTFESHGNIKLSFLSIEFAHGDSVHVAAYPVSAFPCFYRDPTTQRYAFTSGLGEKAARTMFVMP